jgi:hypothetical protein
LGNAYWAFGVRVVPSTERVKQTVDEVSTRVYVETSHFTKVISNYVPPSIARQQANQVTTTQLLRSHISITNPLTKLRGGHQQNQYFVTRWPRVNLFSLPIAIDINLI